MSFWKLELKVAFSIELNIWILKGKSEKVYAELAHKKTTK